MVAAVAIGFATPAAAQVTVSGTAAKPFTTPSNSSRWLDSQKRDLNGLRLSNFDIVIERNMVRIDEGQGDIVIKDGRCRLKTPTTGSNLPVCIEVIDGHDVLIQNVRAEDFLMQPVKGVVAMLTQLIMLRDIAALATLRFNVITAELLLL